MNTLIKLFSILALIFIQACDQDCCEPGSPTLPAMYFLDESTGLDLLDTANGGLSSDEIRILSQVNGNLVSQDFNIIETDFLESSKYSLSITSLFWSGEEELMVTLELRGYGVYDLKFLSEKTGAESYQFTELFLDDEKVTETNSLCRNEYLCQVLRIQKKE